MDTLLSEMACRISSVVSSSYTERETCSGLLTPSAVLTESTSDSTRLRKFQRVFLSTLSCSNQVDLKSMPQYFVKVDRSEATVSVVTTPSTSLKVLVSYAMLIEEILVAEVAERSEKYFICL